MTYHVRVNRSICTPVFNLTPCVIDLTLVFCSGTYLHFIHPAAMLLYMNIAFDLPTVFVPPCIVRTPVDIIIYSCQKKFHLTFSALMKKIVTLLVFNCTISSLRWIGRICMVYRRYFHMVNICHCIYMYIVL